MNRLPLRKGYTTGACAAAASKGAAYSLLNRVHPEHIDIFLPNGERAVFQIKGSRLETSLAEVYVIKDAGDDPDVTNGIAIYASIREISDSTKSDSTKDEQIILRGGEGVGIVTRDGLPVEKGGYAINPVPRKMIAMSLSDIIDNNGKRYEVTITVPEGKKIAKKTLNKRLGIIDGISILGTTGIVEPMSHEAYKAVVDILLDIARLSDMDDIVFTTGRTTYKYAKGYLDRLRDDHFIKIGDFVGSSIESAVIRGFKKITIFCQIGKLSKIADGHFCTHAYSSSINRSGMADIALETGYAKEDIDYILSSNTMSQVSKYIALRNGSRFFHSLTDKGCSAVKGFIKQFSSHMPDIRIVLVSGHGEVLSDVSSY